MKRLVLCSAIIWAAVIFASAIAVPEVFGKLIPILGGGSAAHIIILGSQCKQDKSRC